MEDEKSKWEKLKEGIGEATDTFSGKKTEDLVNEYTDLYTKVILGLHQDVEAQKDEINSFQSDRDENAEKLSELSARLDQLESLVEEHSDVSTQVIVGLQHDMAALQDAADQTRIIALAALAVSLIALVGVIWKVL
jgi:uncharacterized phage infection (PIP) family protein YhgE